MTQDLVLFTRTFDLLEWLLPKAEKFPRQFRATVVQRLMDAVLDFNEAVHDAHRQGGSTRERHLRQADAHLDTLRVYLRLAHHWRWLSTSQYGHVSAMVAEIGRLLGGWLKVDKTDKG
ncbi:MAG: diversity-generating retroelement protein Avd [Anaerolineae bacterium]